MGGPNKSEQKKYESSIYTVWYYITEPPILGQSRLVSRNYTPLVFQSDKLIGWGKKFYRYTFDIDNERYKQAEESRQAYTDDKEEWPRNEHSLIPGMQPTQSTENENALKAPVNQELQNEQINEQEILKHDQKAKTEETIPNTVDQKNLNGTEKPIIKDKNIKPEEFKAKEDSKKENFDGSCKIKSTNDENKEDPELKYNLWE
jgi:hypothetical protein